MRSGGVERRHELRQRRFPAEAVVLQLHQRRQVGLQRLHGGHQLGLLALVVLAGGGTARGGEAAAAAVAVEQVEQVETGDAAVALHLGRGRARGLFDPGDLLGQLKAVAAEALVEHAGHAVQGAAHAQRAPARA